MLLENLLKNVTALALACLIVSPAIGQETAVNSSQPANIAVLTADGQLNGSVALATDNQIDPVPSVKVSLVSYGKVIDSVTSDAAGQFSFANVHPGPYQVVGTATGLVGSQALQVAEFTDLQPATSGQLLLTESSTAETYSSFANAPLSTMCSSPACSSCSSCSSRSIGFGGGGGRAIGGQLGRGFLRSPRGLLVVGGIVGGVVGGVGSGNDSSPDQ